MGGEHGTAWLLAQKHHQSALHSFILVTCGHVTAWNRHSVLTHQSSKWAMSNFHPYVGQWASGTQFLFSPSYRGWPKWCVYRFMPLIFSFIADSGTLTLFFSFSNIYFVCLKTLVTGSRGVNLVVFHSIQVFLRKPIYSILDKEFTKTGSGSRI